jgi:hypothetical protein
MIAVNSWTKKEAQLYTVQPLQPYWSLKEHLLQTFSFSSSI